MNKPNSNTVPSPPVVPTTDPIAAAATNKTTQMTVDLSSLSDLAARINAEHEAHQATSVSVEHAIVAGKLLLHAKVEAKQCGEKWMAWVEANCKFSGRTARLYMQIAKNPPEMATVANLTLQGCARKKASAKTDRPAKDLKLAWKNASKEELVEVIKPNLSMVKELIKQIESAVEQHRGETEKAAA
ncbi:MAG: hypothetical protein ACLPKB_19815 [Xanthobacteraceae bacterium]